MEVEIIQANPNDLEKVSAVLQEVADWLIAKDEKLWERNELSPSEIREQVENGMFWLAFVDSEVAGCIRYQTEDMEYWDDVPHKDSAFVHRVAVRRKFGGKGISKALIEWAKQKAKSEGKKYLRLDCTKREKLCRLYESYGFVFHSEKVRKPYLVVRYQFDLDNI